MIINFVRLSTNHNNKKMVIIERMSVYQSLSLI